MARIYPDDIANPVGILFRDGAGDFRMARIDDYGRVRVRGEDQLFSYLSNYRELGINAAADVGYNTVDLAAVPAGEIWVVTSVIAFDTDTALPWICIYTREGGVDIPLKHMLTLGAEEAVIWTGRVYLEEGGLIRGAFDGCTAGDYLSVGVHGYKMTLET